MRRESTEELLRESEERYRSLAELSPDAIAVQSGGRLVYANAAGLKLLGATCLEEVLGRPMLDFIHPDFHEAARARMRQVEEGQPVALMEQRWVRPDGRVIDVEAASAPIIYQGRSSSQIVVRDVTGRKRMEGELREAEAEYRSLVEQIPAATYRQELGEDTVITYISPRIETITGYSPEEYVSDPELWMRIIHPEDRERVLAEDLRAGRSGEPFRIEYRTFARDGRTVWVRDEAVVVNDENGEPLYWQGIVLDITESKLAEQELHRAAAHNKAILGASPDLMFLLNRDGELLDFRTPDVGKLFVPPEKIVGSRLDDLVPPEVSGPALTLIGRALDSGEVQTYEYRLLVPEGVRDFEARLVKSGADEVLAIVRDVTERKRSEGLLRQQSAAMTASIDGMAVLDESGVYTYMNDAHAEIYGYDDPEELLGKTWKALYDEREAERLERDVMPVLREKGRWRGESTGKKRDGSTFPQEVSLTVIEGSGFVCVARNITERRRSEAALKESEERYRAVIEQSAEAIWLFDPDTKRVLESNTSFQELLGYTAEELREMTNYDFVAHSREDIDALVRRKVQEGKSLPRERKYRRKDGTLLDVEVGGAMISYFGKRVVCSVARDLTEHKRAEATLKESEERYRRQVRELSLLHQVRTALAQELDLPAAFRAVVEAIADTYGYAQVSAYLLDGEELTLQHQVGYEHVIERVHVSEGVMGRVARTGKSVLLEDVRDDPAFLGAIEGVVSEVGVPLFDEGRVVGVLNVESTDGIELTEDDLRLTSALGEHVGIAIGRARLYTQVRESEERFRSLVQNASDAISILDANSTIIYDSPAIERTLGYKPEERIGTKGLDYVHPEDVAFAERTFSEVLSNPGVGLPIEYRLRHKDGSWRDFEAIRTNLLDDPAVRGVVLNYRDVTRRKRYKSALQESEERYRTLMEQSVEAIYLYDAETKCVLESNAAFRKMMGYSSEELIGKKIYAFIAHDPQDIDRNIQRSLREKRRHIGERNYRRKDGSVIVVETSATVIPYGGRTALCAVSRDVTERRRIQEALRESEERYRSVVDNVKEVIFQTDMAGLWTFLNPAWTEITGFSLEESIGTNFLDYVHPEDRQRNLECFRPLIERKKDYCRHEIRYLTRDGGSRWIEVFARLTLASDGTVLGTSGTLNDITERKQAEQRLEESEQRYKSLYEHNPDAVYSFDLEGAFLSANPACEEVSGYSVEELLGMSFEPLIVPEDLKKTWGYFEKAARGEPQNYEIAISHKLGHRVELNVTNLPIVVAGEIVGVYGIAKDITERKQEEQARARLAAIVESSDDAIISRTLDGVITSWNPGAERLYGYCAREVKGRSSSFLYPPEHPREMPEILEKIRRGESIDHYETVRMTKDGRRVHVSLSVSPIRDASGNSIGDSGIARDITEQKRAEETLRQSEERYRAVVERTTDGIFLGDFETSRILETNAALQNMLGYTSEEMRGMPLYDLIVGDPESIDRNSRRILEDKSFLIGERQYRRKDGSLVHVETSATLIPYGGKEVSCCIARDITERKALEEKLSYQAFHDPLTGLPNRSLFLNRLDHALARAGRQRGSIAVLYVDLDNFKIINDSLGHEMGDRVLVEAGRRLRSCLRPADTVARLGGDEFIVLLENNAGIKEATWISERILEKFRGPLFFEGQETFITPSIGIFLAGPGSRPEEILRNSDLAMYRAKEKGKAQYEVFDPAMHDRALKRLKLEADLRLAIERSELRVHYQPKICLETGKTIGMEALARWERPGLGIVLPEEFVPLAEETGLIIPIGQWLLEEACRQGHEWQERYPADPPLKVCVNLSAREFQRHDLTREIAGVLGKTGLDPRSLILEITESVIMDEARSSIAILEGLRDLGVRLAIDDFGTGYSSLSYLNRFPVDFLKIDQSFVEGLPEGPEDTAVVSSIIALAHTLGMQVIAEGVETSEQLRILRELDCDIAQGHYFSKALTYDALSAFLGTDPHW